MMGLYVYNMQSTILSCQISQFCYFQPRLTGEPVKMTYHVGYVLDRSRAEQFKNGIDHKLISIGQKI